MNSITVAPSASLEAGQRAATILKKAIAEEGLARVIFASAPSQEGMLRTLCSDPDVDWSKVQSFHMDEYLGLPMDDSRAFGQWLLDRLPAEAHAGFHRIDSTAEARAEIDRYSAMIDKGVIHLTCLGVGMNGHVAFNEPGTVDFDGAELVRLVELDEMSRLQQVEEGLFSTVDEVPTHAVTLTFAALARGSALVCTVLGQHKAAAVAAAIDGPITEDCPASGLKLLRQVHWFLDPAAGSALQSMVSSGS